MNLKPDELLDIIEVLERGRNHMSFEDFSTVLQESLGMSESYAQGCWIVFQDHTLSYLCTRNPGNQSLALLAKMWELGQPGQ
jgi:hypothetical protein